MTLSTKPQIVVVDDYLKDPDAVREMALSQKYVDSNYYKGRRSEERFLDLLNKEDVEQLLHRKIVAWEQHDMNGRFQYCIGGDQLVYHTDFQTHAAIIYLTPDAPVEAGLSFYKSKITGLRRAPTDKITEARMFRGNLLDKTKWEETDRVANLYNRLILWDGRLAHAPSVYFGHELANARLFQIFFFDME